MFHDMWSGDYGNWQFDPSRFPDPAAMARTLHDWGCHLMLWVVPYISPDSPAFRDLEREGLLLRAADGLPAIRRDRKSTRLNSSHVAISYAVFCLKKKKT